MKKSLSVVIPIYNESDNIESLAQEIIQTLSAGQYEYEIIFVDDGSQDNTLQRLQELAAQQPVVKIVSHKTNYGQSAGLISGGKAAQYPWIVTLDGDGQNDPNDIPLLWEALEKQTKNQNPSVIFGNRKQRNDSFMRKLSSRIGNGVRQALLKDNCNDTGCSLKLFPREIFLQIPRFNHLHRFLPALFQQAGFQIVNVPVNHRPRLHGVSKYGVSNRLWTGILDLLGVMWLKRRACYPETKSI